MVAVYEYGDQVLYATQDAQDAHTTEYLTLPTQNSAGWNNVAVTSDDRPIASFYIGSDKQLIVAEQTSGGSWQYESVGQDIFETHGLDLDLDDEPVISHRRSTNDGLRLLTRTNQGWTDELVVADANHGYFSDLRVDDLGDPHVIYMAEGSSSSDNPMYYLRWDGADWQSYHISGVDRAFYPRIALDSNGTAHAAVYDPSRSTVSYTHLAPN